MAITGDDTPPIRLPAPAPVPEGADKGLFPDLDYFAFGRPDQLETLKKQIEDREKLHFNLVMAKLSLEDNPENGEHNETAAEKCFCNKCELKRVVGNLASLDYAIRRLRAFYSTLT
jgi:hypothetical protein